MNKAFRGDAAQVNLSRFFMHVSGGEVKLEEAGGEVKLEEAGGEVKLEEAGGEVKPEKVIIVMRGSRASEKRTNGRKKR